MTTPDETATCPKVRDLFPSMPGTVLLQCTRPEGHLGRHRGNDVEWWGGDHGSKCPSTNWFETGHFAPDVNVRCWKESGHEGMHSIASGSRRWSERAPRAGSVRER